MKLTTLLITAATLLTLGGCSAEEGDTPPPASATAGKNAPPTNRIDVSPAVRRNLGITFARVEQRKVASTIRVPGRFELMPKASREYHTTLGGRVELLVDQYQQVDAGTPLYRVDSPQWRDMQQKLSQTVIAIQLATRRLETLHARVKAVGNHEQRLRDQATVWDQRVKQINELIAAGSGAASELADARSQLAAIRTSLAEVEEEKTEVRQQQFNLEAELNGYRQSMPLLYADALGQAVEPGATKSPHIDLALTPAAATLGIAIDDLRKNIGTADHPLAYWRSIDQVEFVARQAGVIQSLAVTNGAWVEASGLVLTTVDPKQIRFRAIGLQADLGRLKDDLPVQIIPPRGGAQSLNGTIGGKLTIGLEADPLERKVDLVVVPSTATLPAWAHSGVSAEMEIVLDQTVATQLAIPSTSVIKDGLDKVVFRRDPKNPDKVIRIDADLGISDGRWIVIESGVMAGDEVVNHGVYELMLASGNDKQQGGHFHADGAFHEGDEH